MSKVIPLALSVCTAVAGHALAQQPGNDRATSLVTSYYAQPDSARSPSDLPVEEPTVSVMDDTKGGKGCDDSCGKGGDDCGCSCYLFGPDEAWTLMPENDCRNWTIGGWFSFGYHSEVTPLSVNRADGLSFNDLPDDLNLHQAWLYAEREADGECGWDWGYRLDVMYGTDAQKTQAFGNSLNNFGDTQGWDNTLDNGVYGWAIPQAYLQVANGDLSIIAGHFFTLVGYEVVTAPDNFFYSHSLTMFNSEPFTHTGVLASYQATDSIEVHAGWTLGWDTGFDNFAGGSSWLGGFSYAVNDCATITYISTAGNFGQRGKDGYSHSVVMDFDLTCNLKYVVQSDYVSIREGNPGGNATGVANDQVGLNNYLFYTINDCWKAGVRAEWWKSDGNSFQEVTVGLNYRPHANVVIRPEYRYDFGNTPLGVDNNGNVVANDISTFGIDAIFTY